MRAIMFSCVTAGAAAGITDARASGRVRVVYSIEHIYLVVSNIRNTRLGLGDTFTFNGFTTYNNSYSTQS